MPADGRLCAQVRGGRARALSVDGSRRQSSSAQPKPLKAEGPRASAEPPADLLLSSHEALMQARTWPACAPLCLAAGPAA